VPRDPAHVVQRRLSALSVSARKRSYARSRNSFEVKPVRTRTLEVGSCGPPVHRCRRSPPMDRRCGSSTAASVCHLQLSVSSFLVAIRLQLVATGRHVAPSSRPVPPLRLCVLAAAHSLHAGRIINRMGAASLAASRDRLENHAPRVMSGAKVTRSAGPADLVAARAQRSSHRNRRSLRSTRYVASVFLARSLRELARSRFDFELNDYRHEEDSRPF
jgi:hypothetical protein